MRLLFIAASFLGASLLFCVQPMIAKMVLPQFGGAPAVWNTCLVFFQMTLLAGYAMVHVTGRWLGARHQAVLQLVLLALPIAVLPLVVPAEVTVGGNPAVRLVGILSVTVGLPFFVVATTAPVLQRWFAATADRRAGDPYFLYAASNSGSLLALIGYVTLIEPNLTLGAQTRLWAAGYAVLAGMILACAVSLWRAPVSTAKLTSGGRIQPRERVRWVALAFAPSSLLLAVTTYLTTDLAALPLLWVIPLSLYLISFIIAFANPPTWILRGSALALPVAIVATLTVMFRAFAVPHWATFSLHLSTFFLAATSCHIEVAGRRPPASHLTDFYMMISLGGVLGGLFNVLIAPVIFKSVEEYPLGLALVAFLVPASLGGIPLRGRRRWVARLLDVALPLLLGAVSFAALQAWGKIPSAIFVLTPLAACLFFVLHPLRFALALAVITGVFALIRQRQENVVLTDRSFFGVLRVKANVPSGANTLMHGRTIHGMQRRSPDVSVRSLPLTYYYPTGPIGQVFESYLGTPVVDHVAVIGLGVGSLAAYGLVGREFTFFEIDPAVERIARDPAYFHYLDDCLARLRVVIGDARLSLGREPDRAFGLIVLDAFSGDAIPLHLLTREALRIYLAKLADRGLIALHITNKYLDLLPAVEALALDAGLAGRFMDETDRPLPLNELVYGRQYSHWVVLARRQADLARISRYPGWRPLAVRSTRPVWTDDYSDLLDLLRWR